MTLPYTHDCQLRSVNFLKVDKSYKYIIATLNNFIPTY